MNEAGPARNRVRRQPPTPTPELSLPDVPVAKIPASIGIIMDGNGRWAKRLGWERIKGHTAGIDAVRETSRECAKLGVKELTLYAFSVENWKRPRPEVEYLMGLLRRFAVDEREEIEKNAIRFTTIGRVDELPRETLVELRETERLSADHDGMVLRLALNYGGRSEFADAAKRIAREVAAGTLRPDDIDESAVQQRLYDPAMRDVDLVIRTAGEMRISNFLLWQISYAEIFVTDALWPEFRKPHLHAAIRAFATRERRFGGLVSQ
ncbi:MAG: di-trans,poly-cis-decaprenylcistransferase [Planctomycetes bacterium]|nr:di-trans,poly-cis-decaprenylcistransferase [Planctomycetota bacterium]